MKQGYILLTSSFFNATAKVGKWVNDLLMFVFTCSIPHWTLNMSCHSRSQAEKSSLWKGWKDRFRWWWPRTFHCNDLHRHIGSPGLQNHRRAPHPAPCNHLDNVPNSHHVPHAYGGRQSDWRFLWSTTSCPWDPWSRCKSRTSSIQWWKETGRISALRYAPLWQSMTFAHLCQQCLSLKRQQSRVSTSLSQPLRSSPWPIDWLREPVLPLSKRTWFLNLGIGTCIAMCILLVDHKIQEDKGKYKTGHKDWTPLLSLIMLRKPPSFFLPLLFRVSMYLYQCFPYAR